MSRRLRETDFVSSSWRDDFYVRRYSRATFLRRSFACFCAIITYVAVDALRRVAVGVFLMYRPDGYDDDSSNQSVTVVASDDTTLSYCRANSQRSIRTATDPSVDRVQLACDATDSTRSVKINCIILHAYAYTPLHVFVASERSVVDDGKPKITWSSTAAVPKLL